MNKELATFNIDEVSNLTVFENKQKKLVEENPFIDIDDTKSFSAAKKARTALRGGRTDLDKQSKLITQKINEFKGLVKNETERLIQITRPHEIKQQQEIDRWEAEKKREKEEAERLEQERKLGIQNAINRYKQKCTEIIDGMHHENIVDVIQSIESNSLRFSTEFDFMEFFPDFRVVDTEIKANLDSKAKSVRLARDLELEKEKSDRANKELEEVKEELSKMKAQLKESEIKDQPDVSDFEKSIEDSIDRAQVKSSEEIERVDEDSNPVDNTCRDNISEMFDWIYSIEEKANDVPSFSNLELERFALNFNAKVKSIVGYAVSELNQEKWQG